MKSFFYFILYLGQPKVHKYFRHFQSTQWYSNHELEILQFNRMKQVLENAYKTPFYKEKFDKSGVTPQDFQALSDIQKFPITTKKELKEALYTNKFPNLPTNTSYLSTTGSSGNPFTFPINKDAQDERTAVLLRTLEWYGHYLGVKNARFWRNKKKSFTEYLKQNVFGRRLDLPVFDASDPINSRLTEQHLYKYISTLNKNQPPIIDGYVSTLVLIAKYILDNDIAIYQPHAIVTGAEFLSEESREIIEKAFKTNVFNRYGGTEISLMAHEDEYQYLNIMADRLYLELLNGDVPVTPGERGEITITDFTNTAMPFIRYKVGDIAIAEDPDKRSPSGRPFPLLKSIEGRINDVMPLKDGSVIVTHLWFKLFREFNFITQFQIIQEDYDLFEINVVLDHNEGDLTPLKYKVQEFVPDATFKWNIVNKIPHGTGGKFRHTISHVPNSINEIRNIELQSYPVEIFAINNLLPHEETEPTHLEDLIEQINHDQEIKKPIIIDQNSGLIIDGHHRYYSLFQLGYSYVPVIQVNYFDEQISVFSDHPQAQTKNQILNKAQQGQTFPYKTTKHVYGQNHIPLVQCAPNASINLDKLIIGNHEY